MERLNGSIHWKGTKRQRWIGIRVFLRTLSFTVISPLLLAERVLNWSGTDLSF